MKKNRGVKVLTAAITLLALCGTANSQQLMSVIKNHSNLSAFANALESNGLDEKLSGSGTFTVFAPVNASFERELSGKNPSSSSVRSTVLNHIMTGYATERNMRVMSKATSLGGITLVMEIGSNRMRVNDIEIIQTNIKAQNGVLHIIRGVLK